jgi:hypothetical protein
MGIFAFQWKKDPRSVMRHFGQISDVER